MQLKPNTQLFYSLCHCERPKGAWQSFNTLKGLLRRKKNSSQRRSNIDHAEHAFTLVEIMMVVVILGMVAMFVMPNYSKSVTRGQERSGGNNLMVINAAQQINFNNTGVYRAEADLTDETTTKVNLSLNLGIIGNGIDYACTITNANPPTFNCTATLAGANGFTLRITNANPNVCCTSGAACPGINPDC